MNLKSPRYLYFFCLALLALAACKNNNDAPTIIQQSSLNVVNLVPDASSINFYSNGTRQNSYKLGYGLASEYIVVPSQQTLAVKDSLYNVLYAAPFTFNPNTNYTLLVTGQATKQNVTGILTIDTASGVTGKVRARFINASPNAPALDVFFNSVAISNRSYKSVSGFSTVDTGTVSIKINVAGTNTNIVTAPFILTAGGVYTFYVYGLYNGLGTTAFTLTDIINQ